MGEEVCSVDELACHHQEQPFPGGIVFHISVTRAEAIALLKRVKLEAGTYHAQSDCTAGCKELEAVLFEYLRLSQQSRANVKYVLNRLTEASLSETICSFVVEGSPVVKPICSSAERGTIHNDEVADTLSRLRPSYRQMLENSA